MRLVLVVLNLGSCILQRQLFRENWTNLWAGAFSAVVAGFVLYPLIFRQ